MKTADIAIVGAGIAGLVVALMLARRGHRCELYESGAPEGCSRHAGGMLAPLAELDIAEPQLARIGLDAVERWTALLGDAARGDLYDSQGSLLVAHRPEWPLLEQLHQRARAAGLEQYLQPVESRRIAELEPWMSGRLRRGLWIPSEGVVHPERVLPALRERVREAGVSLFYERRVQALASTWIELEGERRVFACVVDCRGLAARDALPLRGVRGEYAVVRPRAPMPTRAIRLMHPRYPLYLVPRPDGQLYIGATQLESEHGGPVHLRSALELLSALYSLAPGFADAELVKFDVGLRPALSNNLPLLRHEPGLLVLNGLFRHGYLLAPVLAAWAADLIEGRALPEQAAPFVHAAAP